MTHRIRTPLVLRGGFLLVALLLVVAGCTDSDDSADSADAAADTEAAETTPAAGAGREESGAGDVAATTVASDSADAADAPAAGSDSEDGADGDAGEPAGGGDDGGRGGEIVPAALQPADIGRSIVYTANVAMTVDDVTVAEREAQVIVEGLGGLLFGQESSSSPTPRSVLTFKIVPGEFRTVLERFRELGKVDETKVTADDVTERVVDLESRIATAETSVARLRDLLTGATDLQSVATLEAELLARETQLEQLRGQLRTLQDQVSLATIVLTLTQQRPDPLEPAVALAQTAYEGHDEGAGCPGDDDVHAAEDEALTVCFTVVNTGNTPLGGIEVSDDALGIDEDDLLVIEGDPAAVLEPDGELILAYETTARPGVVPTPEVTAAAVRPDGEPRRIEVVTEREPVVIDVAADTSLPGFGDSLAAGGRTAQWLGSVVLVSVGAVLPFVWIPVLVAAGWALYRRRRPSTAQS